MNKKLLTNTQIFEIKNYFSDKLCQKLNLSFVQAPLFLPANNGVNDWLNGVEPPIIFKAKNNSSYEIIHSLAKWKRIKIGEYQIPLHNGIVTNMIAIRQTEDLDSIHSYLVDQWDWEMHIEKEDRNVKYLKNIVNKIAKSIYETQEFLCKKYSNLKRNIDSANVTYITTQELEDKYPDKTPKEREYLICNENKGRLIFLMQIGGKLKSGISHDGRSTDYDDWTLNGDILVYNKAIKSSFELSSMGIRVDANSLKSQLHEKGMYEKAAKFSYHQNILSTKLPLTIGGGIGQSRLFMLLLNKKEIAEVQVSDFEDKKESL